MKRTCEVCGVEFEAQRSTAKACSSSCRARKSMDGGQVRALPTKPPVSGLVESVRSEFAAAGREESALGQAALVIAGRIASGDEPASAVAALNRELRATLSEALRTTSRSAVGSLRDELAERRARA
jgi:hypothetical protein